MNSRIINPIAAVLDEAYAQMSALIGEWSEIASRDSEDMAEQFLAGVPPEKVHATWKRSWETCGWGYGPEYNHAKKTHPALVEYDDLTRAQLARYDMLRHLTLAMHAAFVEAGIVK